MGVLRSFVRRLPVQAIVSGTVMAGLQGAVRFGPEVFLDHVREATVEKADGDLAKTAGTVVPAATVDATTTFAQDRTRTDVKAGRFPVWRGREATATVSIPPLRLTAKGAGSGLGDVVLFDRCRPDCESRDPLLASNRRPATSPSTPPATAPEVLDDSKASPAPDTAEADSDRRLPLGDGIVAATTRGGLSVARRIVGTAGSVVGW